MKRILPYFLIIFSYSCSSEIKIPDENFKNTLLNHSIAKFYDYPDGSVDINKNGKIDQKEAENVKALWLPEKNISSLKGLSHFKNLVYLECSGNNLKTLDISQNKNLEFLSCSENTLKELDLSNNLNLEFLSCIKNEIKEINLAQNLKLAWLNCNSNFIEKLNLDKNESLDFLSCSNNQISKLNLIHNTKLRELFCENNNLKSLKYNDNLRVLSCQDNPVIDCLSFGLESEISH